ncbi:hypothetical protein GIB67_029666 [Kingdonia uniflora]|uniref:Probable ubiquitin-like-specific protease 2A/B PH domain-containing protein n=1 Tax=Kingdonia uniflora TaxID=39325 RepID=A0A7J7LLH4_9MAGN|nr:hypothetical protein GIB67_029666 [Kingdonia uniflora]
MKGTNREGIDVYDFVDDAETEQCTTVYSRRFLNPNKVKEISPLDKYKFLEVCSHKCLKFFYIAQSYRNLDANFQLHGILSLVSRGTSASDEEIRNGECVEVDAGDSDHKHKIHDPTLGSSKEDCAATIVISGLDELPFEKRSPIKLKNNDPSECLIVNSLAMDALSLGVPSTQSKQLNCANPDLSSDNDSVDVISDNESAEQSSSSTFSSDIKENQGSIEDSAFEHLSRGWEREEVNMAIDINPDYLIYKDRYCTDSSLTFCCGSVKLEGTNSYDGKESFSFEWPIDEITSVESLWFIRVGSTFFRMMSNVLLCALLSVLYNFTKNQNEKLLTQIMF